jgi:hypothetical protein
LHVHFTPKGPWQQMCHFTTIGHAIVAFFFIMIFENFTRGGEMNKVYGNLFFIQNILSIQNL